MTYPIFNSVVNCIESELNKRDISIKTFKTWNEDRINATGLEIVIDLSKKANFLKALSINFDWDRFRETVLARQLDGMEEHPFLQEENMVSTSISPLIDIEVTWLFDEEQSQPQVQTENGASRLESASIWMEKISSEVNELLAEDDIITRWHVEVEGDEYGKYLSAVNLISYFQYTLTDLKSLNAVHEFVGERLQELLLKSNQVMKISDSIIHDVAA
ncbi:hypothetical protein G3570_09550 [Balneolaceae bacterium YR4-1]|uniref:Uncharacterized protein n=1 Tax=Halalkalibaculum roseum TaxID=2709311 RepID=A0A6M1T285_9BACT|nr:hypothetical protein [Halalkalibaculum roseum]NGP76877.1 hypothetical protein [Halalkalibaculum roseum]